MWPIELLTRRPQDEIRLVYRALAPATLPARLDAARAELERSGVRVEDAAEGFVLTVPWRALVWGLIGREVEERVELRLAAVVPPHLILSCRPQASHDAHAVGAAGAMVFAVVVWITAGWVVGIPAGGTTLLAGWLWTWYWRQMGMQALERRLRLLVQDAGEAAWPEIPAELTPPPTPLVPR